MKIITLFFVTAFFCSHTSYSQTQSQINYQTGEAAKKAERKMDTVYKKILMLYAKDTLFIKNLKYSQKIWLQYSNAQIKTLFPDYGPGYYGSMFSNCVTMYSKKLTELRIHELELWLFGNEEGEGCDGSIKTKNELPIYKSSK